jgi:hypothetical protein
MAMHIGRRDPDIMQQSKLKKLVFTQFRAELAIPLDHHESDPFAVVQSINPDQIQSIGERYNDRFG